jgi:hypothetical protein
MSCVHGALISLAMLAPAAQEEVNTIEWGVSTGADRQLDEDDLRQIELIPEQRANAEAAAGGIMAAAGGLICVVILASLVGLAGFLWVVLDVSKQTAMDTGMKVVWCLVAWFVPILGPVVYYFAGRPSASAPRE